MLQDLLDYRQCGFYLFKSKKLTRKAAELNGTDLSPKYYTPTKEVACAVRTSLYKNRIIYSLESCA